MQICEIDKYQLCLVTNLHYTEIPKITCSKSYSDFFQEFLVTNQPCIIENATDLWNSTKYWLIDENLNFAFLGNKYGNSEVTIYDCNEKYYNSHKTSQCKFKEYLQYWETYKELSPNSEKDIKYLKDWHFKNEHPGDDFYDVPIYFASDWLNEYLVEYGRDDYRFVYMGPQGTWTPFHADVFSSFSWSANVCGRKKWILLPPGEENKLKNSLGNLYFDISDKLDNVKYYEVIQEKGDAIFVPSGWYHQVWNLEDTVSVNHNWINGTNIFNVWKSLLHNLQLVKKEIEDCKDMDDFNGHCQIMLNSSFGMDFHTYYDFLTFIARRRLSVVQENICDIMYNNFILGKNHAIYDLTCIRSVLMMFIENDDVCEINFKNEIEPKDLLQQICEALQNIC